MARMKKGVWGKMVTKKVTPAVKKYVKKAIVKEGEMKESAFTLAGAGIPGSGVIDNSITPTVSFLVNGIPAGVAEGERVGVQMNIKKVNIRYKINSTTLTDLGNQYVRVVLLQNKSTGGSPPVYSGIFNSGVVGTVVHSGYNIESKKDIKILYDKRHKLVNGGGLTDQHGQAFGHIKKLKLNIPVQYTGIGATVTSIRNNSLYLMCTGEVATAATMTVCSGEIHFKDS